MTCNTWHSMARQAQHSTHLRWLAAVGSALSRACMLLPPAADCPPFPPLPARLPARLQVCWDGGDLICCDSCPAAYHPDCLGLSMVQVEAAPRWACPQHQCGACQRKAAVRAGLGWAGLGWGCWAGLGWAGLLCASFRVPASSRVRPACSKQPWHCGPPITVATPPAA